MEYLVIVANATSLRRHVAASLPCAVNFIQTWKPGDLEPNDPRVWADAARTLLASLERAALILSPFERIVVSGQGEFRGCYILFAPCANVSINNPLPE